jgi:hypothetical protein
LLFNLAVRVGDNLPPFPQESAMLNWRSKRREALEALRRRLHGHVDVLAGLIGPRNTFQPEGLVSARRYLRDQLERMGHTVLEQPYKVGGRVALNLEVVLTGRKPSLPELVVGAHYDTATGGTPGADDNTSAVAALLEVARAMAGRQLKRTVRLVFYDTEEMPYFARGEMGSQHHAAVCRRTGRRLMGMICLESIGYFKPPQPRFEHWGVKLLRPLRGRHIVAVSDFRSALFLARVKWGLLRGGWWRTFAIALPKTVKVIHLSDHRGYWEQGFRAVMLTDTAVLRNPNYHELTDTVDTLDYPLLARLTRAVIVCVGRFGS